MLLYKLKCFNQAKCLFNRSTNWQIIYCHLAYNSIWINYKQTPVNQLVITLTLKHNALTRIKGKNSAKSHVKNQCKES